MLFTWIQYKEFGQPSKKKTPAYKCRGLKQGVFIFLHESIQGLVSVEIKIKRNILLSFTFLLLTFNLKDGQNRAKMDVHPTRMYSNQPKSAI
ncbi:MAG: hypothetical protein HC836_36520 [Richelia sp. RM2_1_2]|nr:hypothetical protein [Richelia sp. RM2_1_2]